jgi:hypothetical protein
MKMVARRHFTIAIAGGFYGAAWQIFDHARTPAGTTDFDQIWYAIQAVQGGLDPYRAIGPNGSLFHWDWAFYYPITAVVALWPFGWLPLVAARAAFVGLSSALLAFALSGRGWYTLIIFITPVYVMAAHAAQWSIIFAAAAVMPAVWAIIPAKPNIGVIAGAASSRAPSGRTLWFVLAMWILLLAVSFAAVPGWFGEWLSTARSGEHFQGYIARLGGPLLLLAVVRWRRPEARLLIALALVPHTTVFYETLIVFLVAQSRLELLGLAFGSMIAYVVELLYLHANDTPTLIARQGDVQLWTMLVPALVLVLRRPNEGDVPGWLERIVARWPAWLRGQPAGTEASRATTA